MSSLVLVIGVALLGAWVIQAQSAVAKRQAFSIDTKTALYVAEAGLAEAAFQVSQGKSGNIAASGEPARYANGVYWVEAEELSDQEISLTSTARAGTSQFRVNLRIVPNQNPVSRLGVFGDIGVVIGDRVLVDGYDASLGIINNQFRPGVNPSTTGSGAVVGSNGDVVIEDGTAATDTFADVFDAADTLAVDEDFFLLDPALVERREHARNGTWFPSTTIAGSVVAGPGGVVLSNGSARILSTSSREGRVSLPEVVLPVDLPAASGDLEVMAGPDLVIEDATQRYGTITVRQGALLKVRGPIVIQASEFVIDAGGRVTLDDRDGAITVFVTDRIEFAFGSAFSSIDESEERHGTSILMPRPSDPADDRRVHLEATGDIRGILYAPGDYVEIPQTLRLYGSVVAKHVRIASGSWISHDRSLEVGGSAFPSLPKKRHWQALPMPEALVGPSGVGVTLALDPQSFESGADSARETTLEVLFMDLLDKKGEYIGTIDGLDATQIKRILAVRWMDPDTALYNEWSQPAGASPDDIIARWREMIRSDRAVASLYE